MEGEILNLRDIEQGMEQLNRMPTQQVSIEILPGSKPGYSIVNLTRKKQIPLTVNISFENSSSPSLPCAINTIAAVATIGLLMDDRRNSAFSVIGRPVSRSARPAAP
ncbi:hypothetical protein BIY29_11320 [Brenneria alni]|uniref:ShlB POTRA domain-containing protein n=1 Tax=Brenneria alni TaxID=71656 RepID=A0A421DMU8_9GAMM|nr:hypothetical protein BIY29_11320 [Brenneria alni]